MPLLADPKDDPGTGHGASIRFVSFPLLLRSFFRCLFAMPFCVSMERGLYVQWLYEGDVIALQHHSTCLGMGDPMSVKSCDQVMRG